MGWQTVKEGDSYAKLAAQNLSDPRLYIELMRHNNSKRLRPGDQIYIPDEATLQSESNRILQGKGQASKYKTPGAVGPLGVGPRDSASVGVVKTPLDRPIPGLPSVPNRGHNFGAINTPSVTSPSVISPPVGSFTPVNPYATPTAPQPHRGPIGFGGRGGSRPGTPVAPSGSASAGWKVVNWAPAAYSPFHSGAPSSALVTSATNFAETARSILGMAPVTTGGLPPDMRNETGTQGRLNFPLYSPPGGAKPATGGAYIPVKGEAPIIPGSNDIRLSLGAWAASHPGVPKPQWAQDLDPANMQSWIDKRAAHSGGWIGGLNGTGGTIPQLPEGGVGNYYYSNPYGSYSYRGGYGGGGGGGGGASVPGGIVWRIGLS
jgi:hypothetical protein